MVSQGLNNYRYGYQGSEKDNEVKGNGNSYTTFFRGLDPRLGRWLTIDPSTSSLPWQSPYCSMDNSPILHNDILGDKVIYGGETKKEQRKNKRKTFWGRVFNKSARETYRTDNSKKWDVEYSFNKKATVLGDGGDRSQGYTDFTNGDQALSK